MSLADLLEDEDYRCSREWISVAPIGISDFCMANFMPGFRSLMMICGGNAWADRPYTLLGFPTDPAKVRIGKGRAIFQAEAEHAVETNMGDPDRGG